MTDPTNTPSDAGECAPLEGTPSGTVHRVATDCGNELVLIWEAETDFWHGIGIEHHADELTFWGYRYLCPVEPYATSPAGEVTGYDPLAGCRGENCRLTETVKRLDALVVERDATLSRAQPSDEAKEPLTDVATTSRGYTIFREPNEVGGHRYWSDAIGGGVVVWDTCLASSEELEVAMRCERERTGAVQPSGADRIVADVGRTGAEVVREAAAKVCDTREAHYGDRTDRTFSDSAEHDFGLRALEAACCAAAIRAMPLALPPSAEPAEWRDIASAPRDGTVVWTYTAERDGLPPFQGPCAWHPDAGWFTDELRYVTHWAPLAAVYLTSPADGVPE